MGIRKILPYACIAFLGLIVYFKTLFFGFTGLDDNTILMQCLPFFKNPANFSNIFREDVFHGFSEGGSFYRPILALSFMLDAQFAAKTLLISHLINILMHILSSTMLFLLLLKLKYRRGLALLLSSIFAVHPVFTQAVSWLTGRNDIILTFFVLASFISFINFAENGRKIFFFIHIFFFMLALLTKETAIMLPFLLILYLYLFRKSQMPRASIPFAVTAWVFIIIFWFFLRHRNLINPIQITGGDFLKSFILMVPVTVQLIGKFLFPFNLSVLPTLKDASLIPGVIASAILLISLSFSKIKQTKNVLFGAVWFIFFLWPSYISFFSLLNPTLLDHRAYLPAVGMIIILSEIHFFKNFDLQKKKNILSAVILIVALSAINIYHSASFRNPLAFWKNAVKTSPRSALAHNFLGFHYMDAKMFREAEGEFQKAIQINPLYSQPYENLAHLYFKEDKLDESEELWIKAINIDSRSMVSHYGLGLIYLKRDMFKEAEGELRKACAINPNFDNALFSLGMVYYKQANMKEAQALWLKTLNSNPGHLDAMMYLALAYFNQKDFARAKFYFEKVIKRGVPVSPLILKTLQLD